MNQWVRAVHNTDVAEDVEMDYGFKLGYTYPVNEKIGITWA